MGKHLRRFSQGSPIVSSYIRDLITKDLKHKDDASGNLPYLETLSEYSLVFPIDSLHAIEEHPFITDKRMKTSLEELKVINWCPGIKRLIPLSITNDGNSLCHAVSVALWGIHDRLELRRLVSLAVKSEQQEAFKERWIRDVGKMMADKLQDQEFKNVLEIEWEAQINIANEMKRSIRAANPVYNPLEEIHIFVLANILRRPIIVLADRPIVGSEVETTLGVFGSIYLPLLWSSTECHKTPILLGYSENYFTPLVIFGSSMTPDSSPEVVPLTRVDNSMIEIRYLTETESSYQEQLLKDYLSVVEIEATKSGKYTYVISAAKLSLKPLAETINMLQEFLSTENEMEPEDSGKETKEPVSPVKMAQRRASLFRCGNKSCSLFITNDSTFPYCTDCYQRNANQQVATRKENSQASLTPPATLDVECTNVSCPYFAAVNSFPYCQRCNLRQMSEHERSQRQPNASVKTPKKELSLEEKWLKLAMGIIDEEVVTGKSSSKTDIDDLVKCVQKFPEQDEYMFANKHRIMLLEEDEDMAIGGVTLTRSLSIQEDPRPRKSSITGGRSNPLRKLSIEENAAKSGGEWQRRVSWINEPCKKLGCSYFASLHTFPYCNQCAEMKDIGVLPPQRKISGIARILPAFTTDE